MPKKKYHATTEQIEKSSTIEFFSSLFKPTAKHAGGGTHQLYEFLRNCFAV